jgi:hypothetical protein
VTDVEPKALPAAIVSAPRVISEQNLRVTVLGWS